MPWRGVTVSEQRQRFLEDYQLNGPVKPSPVKPRLALLAGRTVRRDLLLPLYDREAGIAGGGLGPGVSPPGCFATLREARSR